MIRATLHGVLILKFAIGPEELSCLSRNFSHYSARPMHFWSRGPSEFHLGYVTENALSRKAWKDAYRDKAKYSQND